MVGGHGAQHILEQGGVDGLPGQGGGGVHKGDGDGLALSCPGHQLLQRFQIEAVAQNLMGDGVVGLVQHRIDGGNGVRRVQRLQIRLTGLGHIVGKVDGGEIVGIIGIQDHLHQPIGIQAPLGGAHDDGQLLVGHIGLLLRLLVGQVQIGRLTGDRSLGLGQGAPGGGCSLLQDGTDGLLIHGDDPADVRLIGLQSGLRLGLGILPAVTTTAIVIAHLHQGIHIHLRAGLGGRQGQHPVRQIHRQALGGIGVIGHVPQCRRGILGGLSAQIHAVDQHIGIDQPVILRIVHKPPDAAGDGQHQQQRDHGKGASAPASIGIRLSLFLLIQKARILFLLHEIPPSLQKRTYSTILSYSGRIATIIPVKSLKNAKLRY